MKIGSDVIRFCEFIEVKGRCNIKIGVRFYWGKVQMQYENWSLSGSVSCSIPAPSPVTFLVKFRLNFWFNCGSIPGSNSGSISGPMICISRKMWYFRQNPDQHFLYALPCAFMLCPAHPCAAPRIYALPLTFMLCPSGQSINARARA